MTMPPPAGLTRREREILRLIADGRSDKQIARLLGIQYGSVKNANTRIYAKIGVQSRTQAALKVALGDVQL